MDHLAPAPDLPAAAREVLRLWDVNGNPASVRLVSRFPEWSPMQVGEAIAAAAAGFLHAREASHRDEWQLKDDSDELRVGFARALSRAHAAHDPSRYDDWGAPFKARFATIGCGAGSVLAKDFPELLTYVADDETAIVYWPEFREFGIAVLNGGPGIAAISHDPFSGKPLPASLRDQWFDTVEKLLRGRYRGPDETPLPDEFSSEAWWLARGL